MSRDGDRERPHHDQGGQPVKGLGSDPGWWAAIMLGMQQANEKLQVLDQTTRYVWLIVGIGVTLLTTGVAGGLGFATWQGTPETARAGLDTATAVSERLQNHLRGTTEPIIERIEILERQGNLTSSKLDTMNARLGRLYNLNVRFLCNEAGRTVPECELQGLGGIRR